MGLGPQIDLKNWAETLLFKKKAEIPQQLFFELEEKMGKKTEIQLLAIKATESKHSSRDIRNYLIHVIKCSLIRYSRSQFDQQQCPSGSKIELKLLSIVLSVKWE